jgi:hypothetical protein
MLYPADAQNILDDITDNAISYLDKATANDYNDLVKTKTDLTKNLLNSNANSVLVCA